MNYIYTAYGLLIESSLRLDELAPGGTGAVDVRVRAVANLTPPADAIVDRGWFRSTEDWLFLHVDGVADFLVVKGSEIFVCLSPGADERDMRAYLLGSCLAAVLQQRDLLALHAAAVVVNQAVILLLGQSGSGKSTLLQAFLRHGFHMLADDVSGITINHQGQPMVMPGIPWCKLGSEVVSKWEIDISDIIPIYSREGKYAIVTKRQFVTSPRPLSSLFVLQPRSDGNVRVSPVAGVDRIRLLLEHTFRPQFLDGLARRREHLRLMSLVAQQSHFHLIDAPRDRFSPSEVVDAILAIGATINEHHE